MGDTVEGSSSAAQGALDPSEGSWLSRLLGRRDAPVSDINGHSHAALPDGGTFNLAKMRVEDVAIPRAEIVAVATGTPLDEVVETFRDSGLSRLPVFTGTLDNPIGLIHLKDLSLKHGFNGKKGKFSLRSLVRPLLFAPPSMPIGVLLQKMQTDRIHMALVIDEYGGVDGLVTLEDLIETVLGEITDEHDVDEGKFWTVEKPGVYLAQARTPLEEFEREIGLDLAPDTDDEEVDTLGGLVFLMTGQVPIRGQVIPHPLGLEFEIVDADPRRIKRLRVRLAPAAE